MNNESNLALVKIDATVEKEFTPDVIELTISFQDELKTKEECVVQYGRDLEAVLVSLQNAGIDRDRVKQSCFRVFPHTETLYKKVEDKEGEKYYRALVKDNGYTYYGCSKVEFEAGQEFFESTWRALFDAEGKFTYDFEYVLKDEAKAEAALLNEAVKQARIRADILADAAGVKLGAVHELSHSFSNSADAFGECYRRKSLIDDALISAVPDFNPEDIEVCCSVSCSWELER